MELQVHFEGKSLDEKVTVLLEKLNNHTLSLLLSLLNSQCVQQLVLWTSLDITASLVFDILDDDLQGDSFLEFCTGSFEKRVLKNEGVQRVIAL